MRIKLLALLVLLTISECVKSQDTLAIRPGNPTIDGSFIQPYTNKWKVTHINAAGEATPNKVWTDYGQIMQLDGKEYFHRVQDLYDPQMNLLDTWINMVELNSLIPISNSTLNPSGKFLQIQFDGSIVKGLTNQLGNGETKPFEANLSEPVFDWNLYGMLLVGLPLKKGLIAKIPYYSLQTNDKDWLIVKVVKKEDLSLPNNKKLSTWVIETNNNLTFWISKSAPYVIKLESYRPDKSKLVWEIF